MHHRSQYSWALAFATASALVAGAAAAQDTAPANEEETPTEVVEEVMVVTASGYEQSVTDAPATMTVMTAKTLEEIPADDFGDLLRNVPGLNVSQTSAREINVTARGSTNTLATSQLVLVDGRSIYLDFFGFVMWDFMPASAHEIKQIEVVQGPASAVWGANAMTGVINVITKRPQEMVGTTVLLGGGELGSLMASVSHAGVSGTMGYKISGGYVEQDAYDRPTGFIPGTTAPLPAFPNEGTEQPKADLRLSWDLEGDSALDIGVGYSGTSGIVHTGIGPFTVDSGSNMTFGKVDWRRNAFNIGFFANQLDADSVGLLSSDPFGNPLPFGFKTDTYNLQASNTSVLGNSTILTYGGNVRQSDFDLQITNPQDTSRDEYGVFAQADIMLGARVRWNLGARYDDVEVVDGVVSPRTSLMFSPTPDHTIRLSYNQAFRAPSVVNNFLGTVIRVPIAPFPITVVGNPNLVEETLEAYEISYSGNLNDRTQMTLAAYSNTTEDSIDFFQRDTYSATRLPPGIPAVFAPCFLFFPGQIVPGTPGVTPQIIGLCTNPALGALASFRGLRGLLPSDFSYRNIGETTDEGIEFSLQQRPSDTVSWYLNASYQKEPDIEGVPAADVNVSPETRGNFGISYDPGRWFVNANVNYADSAYWADVLNIRGTTDSYTMLNAALGFRFGGERATVTITGSNLTDEDVQQHIFGDIIARKVIGTLLLRF
jgi:iron complex outermembrane receptor protein